jgi:hypothetical protein
MSDEEFATGGDVSEKVYPIRAGEVKKGMIVLLKGFPCKVIEVTTSKTGKHGHAKVSCSVRGLAGRRWPAGNLLASRLAGSLALSLLWS